MTRQPRRLQRPARILGAFALLATLVSPPVAPAEARVAVSGRAIRSTIERLASSDFQGRLTGTAGNAAAVDFVAERLRDLGASPLPGSVSLVERYEQPAIVSEGSPGFVFSGTDGASVTLRPGVDFQVLIREQTRIAGTVSARLLELTRERATPGWLRERHGAALLVRAEEFDSILRMDGVAAALFDPRVGPAAIVLVVPETAGSLPRGLYLTGSEYDGTGPMLVQVTAGAAAELAPGRGRVTIDSPWKVAVREVRNVSGRVRGLSSGAPIVVTAHLDGPGTIGELLFAGAVDNASGVGVVLEVARVLATGRGPGDDTAGRPVWVAFFNGEEQGLRGSTAFVGRHADELAGATVINVDMVGHSTEVGFQVTTTRAGGALATAVVNALESELEALARSAPTVRVTQGGGSDHAAFGPSVTSVSIVQAPYRDMHRAEDTADRAEPEILAAVARAVLRVVDAENGR